MANNENATHGGSSDNESVSQKLVAHQTSTVRKAVIHTRPSVNTTEIIVRTLFPDQ